LDVVDIGDLAALSARAKALEIRVAELRELARTLAGDASVTWTAMQEWARAAVRSPVPVEPDVEIIQAWGCPNCGRIDAPKPCLGICIRRPGMVADVMEYRQLAARSEEAATADRLLSGLAHIVASVTPRPGREELTMATLRSRAGELLGRLAA